MRKLPDKMKSKHKTLSQMSDEDLLLLLEQCKRSNNIKEANKVQDQIKMIKEEIGKKENGNRSNP